MTPGTRDAARHLATASRLLLPIRGVGGEVGRPAAQRLSVSVKTPEGRPDEDLIDVGFTGWSPTLHEAVVRFSVPTARDDLAAFAAAVTTVAERQTNRSMNGHSIRRSGPFSNNPMIKIDQMSVDADWLALAGERDVAVVDRVRGTISLLHRSCVHDGGATFRASRGLSDQSVEEIERRDPNGSTARLARVWLELGHTYQTDAPAFDGRMIRIRGEAPATALAALAGRPVGSLARIHPRLDGRIVISASATTRDDAPWIRIETEPRPVPLKRG